MGRTHLLVGAGVVLTVSFFAGCAAKPRQAARRPAPGPAASATVTPQAGQTRAAAPRQTPVDAPAASGDVTPNSLAQHAEVYAQNLESLLAKRGGGTAPPAAPSTAPAAAAAPAESRAADAAPQEQRAATTFVPPTDVQLHRNASASAAPHVPPISNQPMTVGAKAAKPAEPGGPLESVGVAPKSSREPSHAIDEAAAKGQPANDGAAQPAAARASVPTTADELLQKYATRVKQHPRDAAAHLDYQVLQFLRDESVPDLQAIAPLPLEDRELLTALLDGLSNFRGALRAEANMLQAKKVAPLIEMGDRIRSQGELHIPAAALCTRVDAFGVYEPMEPAQFKSNTQGEAVLYCEVANYASQLNDGKKWETKLKYEGVIYSETGLNVWQDKPDTFTDVSRSRRHDFYVVKRMRLPNLPVGRYLLKLTVTDLQMSRVAESTVPIQVIAP